MAWVRVMVDGGDGAGGDAARGVKGGSNRGGGVRLHGLNAGGGEDGGPSVMPASFRDADGAERALPDAVQLAGLVGLSTSGEEDAAIEAATSLFGGNVEASKGSGDVGGDGFAVGNDGGLTRDGKLEIGEAVGEGSG